MKRDDIFYQAMLARDHRFDGKFYVGVKTTGIYCRPICPAKPKRENVEFYSTHIAAEKAGFRPCIRCRPESAPQSPAWIGKSAVVCRAVKIINSQETIAFDEDSFAGQFGVTARHLRRLFVEEIGKTPKQLFFENRLNMARKLICETALPITEIAFAAGFSSIRRFNAAFKNRFKKPPRITRSNKSALNHSGLKILLPYRPPFDFAGLMNSYENHRVGNLEWFAEGKMHRVINLHGKVGKISIANLPEKSSLEVEIDFPDTSIIHMIISRVRNLFDLNSDPVVIANILELDPAIKKLLRKNPGLRLPSGWDPFEVAVSAILGQLVSVKHCRALVHDLIEICGHESGLVIDGKAIKLFPTPAAIIHADLTSLKSTGARKKTLVEFSKAIHTEKLNLTATQDVEDFFKKILSIKGIGPWTAQYIALKSLRNTDTFPASDLILARALQKHLLQIISTMSPWRGYVAALFWRTYTDTLKKTRARSKATMSEKSQSRNPKRATIKLEPTKRGKRK
jgi:AraC family transcriptional regulator of adaptative response / DNA-3-methyladenine glycosylase II